MVDVSNLGIGGYHLLQKGRIPIAIDSNKEIPNRIARLNGSDEWQPMRGRL
jgi:hypothetical protein